MFFAGLLAFVVGSAVMLFLSVVILFGIVGSMTSSEPVTVGEHAILKLDFSEDLIESPSSDPFAGIDFATMTARHQVTLYNALRAIETAKNDPRIQGIYLRPNGGGVATYAILEELREALQDFRQGGKFIIAYNETYGQGGYYLASVADKIYLEPHGGMQWTGVSSTLMFYKGLFDKLDIQAEIFRPTACRYKSAVEPYFLSKMSNANREQMQLLVDSYWNVMAEAVAESRGIELSTLNRLADGLEVSLAQEALDHGMVDGLLFEDQMDDVFREYGAVAKNDGQFEFVTLGQYVSQLNADLKNISSSQIAIVYADGAIVDGEGYGDDIYGNTLAAKLAEVRRNDDVKAVVLRVNSPGGSALASDVIWRSVDEVYETFTSYVAEGRNLPLEKVLDIAGGRVWSGTDALALGLVDTNGGLKTAIAIAADKAELGDKFRIVEMTEAPTGFGAFFSGFMAKVKADIVAGELGPWAGEWRKIREAVGQQGVVMYCPYAVQPEM